LETNTNEIISLIPLPEARISTKNLKWELSNEKLELGIREGARNESIAEFIEIHVHKGELLLYFDAKN
jgi:thiamine pyrophosphokinase